MATPDTHAQVGGSWWTSGAGWFMSSWGWMTGDAAPLTVALTIASLVLTAIKIAQEYRAWKTKSLEQSAIKKLMDRLSRRSGFNDL